MRSGQDRDTGIPRVALRYGIALVSVFAALAVSLSIRPIVPQPGTPLFLGAIMFSAWYGGLGPGLMATIAGTLSINYFLRPSPIPEYSTAEVLRLGLFVMVAVAINVVNQIRERVLTREQLARREAEDASRLKDEFLAMVSHELRTPLGAISGWAEILGRQECDEATAIRAKTAIKNNSALLSRLINDLLDASRSMNGKLQISVRPLSIKTVIVEALDSIRPDMDAKGIHLETNLDVPSDTILGDGNRLKQVICNVLVNAIKFTPEDGRISVRLAPVDSSRIQVIISDTGIGIEKDALPRVFDRFYQSTGGVRRSGLGLGLAIVRELVKLHGGTVEAYSRGQGCGATFTIELPLLENEPGLA